MGSIIMAIAVSAAWFADGPAVSDLAKDRQAILSMAGVYEVEFNFEETVSFDLDYEVKEPYKSSALEIVDIIEAGDRKITLQHILQTDRGVIKHWRQDWEYENRTLLEYQGDRVWEKRELTAEQARGTWTQRVFQVDDSPRYESYGRWRHQGNLSEWNSALTYRPLPRREYTKRDDYNILAARNRHALTPMGWVHEQDNYKLRRNAEGDHVLVREIGLNRYFKGPEKWVAEAAQWWAKHKVFWADVREVWSARIDAAERIALKKEVAEKPLYRHLFGLSEEAGKAEAYDSARYKAKIAEILDQFTIAQENRPMMTKAKAY